MNVPVNVLLFIVTSTLRASGLQPLIHEANTESWVANVICSPSSLKAKPSVFLLSQSAGARVVPIFYDMSEEQVSASEPVWCLARRLGLPSIMLLLHLRQVFCNSFFKIASIRLEVRQPFP